MLQLLPLVLGQHSKAVLVCHLVETRVLVFLEQVMRVGRASHSTHQVKVWTTNRILLGLTGQSLSFPSSWPRSAWFLDTRLSVTCIQYREHCSYISTCTCTGHRPHHPGRSIAYLQQRASTNKILPFRHPHHLPALLIHQIKHSASSDSPAGTEL